MVEPPTANAPLAKRCSRCRSPFTCGARQASCWCQQLPVLPTDLLKADGDCYCPLCLAELTQRAADSHVV